MKIDIDAILKRYRVEKGSGFRLKKYDPDDTAGLKLAKKDATALLQEGVERLSAHSRTCSTRRIAGPCSASSRPWMRRARTARSSTSSPA